MKELKKDLLLICNQFPYSFGETFLSVEFPYLYKSFRKIVIIARTDDSKKTRDIPDNVTLFRKSPKSSLWEKLLTVLYIGIFLRTFIKLINEEKLFYKQLFGEKPDKRIKGVISHDAFKAFELKYFIKRNVFPLIDNNSVLYSYWQNSAALALALIKKELSGYKSFSRAHRADLYFYANENNYLAYRKFISKNMDGVIFISQDGIDYQSKLLKESYNSFFVSKLGTEVLKSENIKKRDNKNVIVSCSSLTPVKRVHLIIEALAQIKEKEIRWVHFGGGILEKELKSLAKKRLSGSKNIEYVFRGNVPNPEIHQFYVENNVDLFINVSESEGIPVSIMEAMSYRIPVIATNVGGTGELVDDECGLLIDKDIRETQLARLIEQELVLNNLKNKGAIAFAKWKENFSASKNFPDFINNYLYD